MPLLCAINLRNMNNEKKVILVVDDSILILERIIPILQEVSGIGLVVHAGTCHEAHNILQTLKPDLILLDIHLPDKSGISLLEFIKTNYQQVVVYMMTSHPTDQNREICQKLGANRFFDKSTDFDLLTETLTT